MKKIGMITLKALGAIVGLYGLVLVGCLAYGALDYYVLSGSHQKIQAEVAASRLADTGSNSH